MIEGGRANADRYASVPMTAIEALYCRCARQDWQPLILETWATSCGKYFPPMLAQNAGRQQLNTPR
eukprot:5621344-Amphidinium_carterae.2